SGNSIGAYDAQGLWAGYSLFGIRFLFTGREWLSDVKLYDYRNRMYQPELGRFMQPDPKEFGPGDYNLYRYCHNDPVNKNDPFGLAGKVYSGGESDWATNYNPTDRIVMVGHGNPTDGLVVNGKPVSAVTIAKDAIAAGYSESKNKVELSICGSGVDGKNSLAQKVANELAARTGVKPDVGAPNGNTANPSYKNDSTGAIRSGPLTGAVDPKTKGTTGEIKHFTAEPPK